MLRYPQFHGCLTYDVESEDGRESIKTVLVSISIFCGQISFRLHRRGQHLRRSHFSSVEGSRLSGARLLHHSSDRCADVRVLRSYSMSTSILSYWRSWSLLRLAFVNRMCMLNHNKTFNNTGYGREVERLKNYNGNLINILLTILFRLYKLNTEKPVSSNTAPKVMVLVVPEMT